MIMNIKDAQFRSIISFIPLFLLLTLPGFAQIPLPGAARLTPEAAWNSTDPQVEQLMVRCWASEQAVARAAVPAVMQDLGAPAAAVELAAERGDGSYLRLMDTSNVVHMAVIHYPLRASDAHELLFLMPDGEVLDVDQALPFPQEELMRDADYVALKERYPELAFHPSDRSPSSLPRFEALPAGRTRVIIEYRLTNGCRACARAGYARGAFYFDAEGRFIVKKFLGIYSRPPARPTGTPADCKTNKTK